MVDITASIIFHSENEYAIPAINSFLDMVTVGRAKGINIECFALLDKPNELTKNIIQENAEKFDDIHEFEFGDLGLSRNRGIELSSGKYLAFFDGDDLWGEDWIAAAFKKAIAEKNATRCIFHPHTVLYFFEQDFDRQNAPDNVQSFICRHGGSRDANFRFRNLLFENTWTANVFCHRKIHEKWPYRAVDKSLGYGVEDWTWNIETVSAGITHVVVPETIHFVRVGKPQSLSIENVSAGLLPFIPDSAREAT